MPKGSPPLGIGLFVVSAVSQGFTSVQRRTANTHVLATRQSLDCAQSASDAGAH